MTPVLRTPVRVDWQSHLDRKRGGPSDRRKTVLGPDHATRERGAVIMTHTQDHNVTPRTCALPECNSPQYQRHSMCGSHYMKWYRHGDPRWVAPVKSADLAGQRFGMLVVVRRVDRNHWQCLCDCGRERRVRAWSLTSGGTQGCGIGDHRRLPEVTYSGAHARLRADLGPASTHQCVDCGRSAQQWSYGHDDPDEILSDLGPYSLKQDHYSPRCVSCHKRFDLGRS